MVKDNGRTRHGDFLQQIAEDLQRSYNILQAQSQKPLVDVNLSKLLEVREMLEDAANEIIVVGRRVEKEQQKIVSGEVEDTE